jgi:hypothetical protein
MSTFIKRDFPVLLIAVLGFLIVFNVFLPYSILSDYRTFMTTLTTIIYYAAFGVGWFYGISAEYQMIRRNRNWQQYFVSAGFFGMLLLQSYIVFVYSFPNAVVTAEYRWAMLTIYQWQSQAQYGIMFLYQCGAVYRVLRLRSMETIVLAIAALAFIFRSIPLFSSIPGIMEFGDWVSGAPVLAGTRAATMTSSIGALVVGLRSLVGKESTVIEVR